jgi:intergrase/recombinase
MSKPIVDAYLNITEKIKDQRKILVKLREEEKVIMTELRDYLNQTDEVGLRIDENTVITLINNDKKINRNKKAYKSYLSDLCMQRGLSDEEFVEEIMKGKVETTVQEQKLKIIKIK